MAKGAQLQDPAGARAMAGLLLMAVVCAPLAGCLFPQDDQVFPELPPKRNAPLKIVDQDPREPRRVYRNSTACPSQNPTFKLIVDDEDIADTVRSRWFVGTQSFEGRNVTATGSRGREVAAPTESGFRAVLANLTAGRTELLTVYVADTEVRLIEGQITVEPRERVLPDGTVVEDEGSLDSFTWVLDVEPCGP